MRKTYKYRLLGNSVTFKNAERWLNLCRNLYNVALEQRIAIYRQDRGTISCYSQMNQLPELKTFFPEYREVDSQVLQDVVERLDRAYKAFFRRKRHGEKKAGLPRFRGRNRYDSFTLKQHSWKINGRYLAVRNIGILKLKLSRPIEGNIKTVTIRRCQTGKWYACFACDKVPERKLSKSDRVIGLDVGIKSFCVDSDGNMVDNPEYFKQSLKKLRRKQRVLFRRKKGSIRRNRARVEVAKAHEKVSNQRNDFLHKLANYYVKNYGVICVEDLNIAGMVRNHKLARSISDAGWGKFIELLEFKAEEAGRKVIRIPRFEPSSKRCSECGAVNHDLTLNERQWVCQSCGVLHERDYNAAKNIRRAGQALQERTYAVTQSVSCVSSVGGVSNGDIYK